MDVKTQRSNPKRNLFLALTAEQVDECFPNWMQIFIEQNKGDIYFTCDKLRNWIRWQFKVEVSGQMLSRNIQRHRETYHIKVYGKLHHNCIRYTVSRKELEMDVEITKRISTEVIDTQGKLVVKGERE